MDTDFLDAGWEDIRLPTDEILQRIGELRKKFQGDAESFRPDGQPPEQLDAIRIVDMSAALQRFCNRMDRVRAVFGRDSSLQDHPWHGIRNTELEEVDISYLPAALEVWQKSLVDLGRPLFAFAKHNNAPAIARATMAQLWALSKELSALPQLTGDEVWDFIPELRGEKLQQARSSLDRYKELLSLEQSLINVLLPWELLDLDAAHRHVKAGMLLSQNLAPTARLAEVKKVLNSLPDLEARLRELPELLEPLKQGMGANAARFFELNPAGIRELNSLLQLAHALPQKYWRLRHPAFDDDAFDEAFEQLKGGIEDLARMRQALDAFLLVDELPPAAELRRLHGVLSRGGKLKWADREWRAARDETLAFATDHEADIESLLRHLPAAASFRERLDALNQDKDLATALAPVFQGIDTDLHAASALRSWYQAVRKEYGAGFGPRVALGNALLEMDADLANSLRQMMRHRSVPLNQAQAEIDALQAIVAKSHPLKQERCDLLDFENGIMAFGGAVKQGLELLTSLSGDEDIPVSELHARIDAHRSLNRDHVKWQRFRSENDLFRALCLDLEANGGSSELGKAEATLKLAEALDQLAASEITGNLMRRRDTTQYRELVAFSKILPKLLAEERRQRETFAELARLDVKAWLPTHQSVKAIHDRNKQALSQEELLPDWLALVRAGQQLRSMGLRSMEDALLSGELSPDQAQTALQAGVYEVLAGDFVSQHAGVVADGAL